ncbi:MAG: PorP/SprF family type IX secretion system membrane protein [Cyclobacteriaceae bacterium]|nr:PorP/SprF family type IX secretion system membrane protein [Cyclobacteriaceae bacterium]
MKYILTCLAFILFYSGAFAQDVPMQNHVFFNPYLINPAMAGYENRPAVFLHYRNQWTGIEGAPTTATLVFHTLYKETVPFAFSVSNDRRGLLSSNVLQMGSGFRANFGTEHYLSFGIGGGMAFHNIDMIGAGNGSFIDPSMAGIFDNSIRALAHAGINYHYKGFNFGITLPTMLEHTAVESSGFSMGQFKPLDHLNFNLSYYWHMVEDKLAIEPLFIYRQSEQFGGRLEGYLTSTMANVFMAGIGYRQFMGASAFIGFNINDNYRFAYSFEFPIGTEMVFNAASHEISIGMVFGEKKTKRGKMSYIQRRNAVLAAARNAPAKQPVSASQRATAQPAVVPSEQKSAPEPEKMQPQSPPVVEEKPASRDAEGNYIGPVEVTRGSHNLELEKGFYVVIASFDNYRDADAYSNDIFTKGYFAKIGYATQTGDYHVYIHSGITVQDCQREKSRLSTVPLFRNAWVLTVK